MGNAGAGAELYQISNGKANTLKEHEKIAHGSTAS